MKKIGREKYRAVLNVKGGKLHVIYAEYEDHLRIITTFVSKRGDKMERKAKCPYCWVGYEPSKCTMEIGGFQLRGLGCPECGDEVFTREQMELVQHEAMEAGVWGSKFGLEHYISFWQASSYPGAGRV